MCSVCVRSWVPGTFPKASTSSWYRKLPLEAVATSCLTPSSWRTSSAPCARAYSFIRATIRGGGFIPQSVVRYTRSGGTTERTLRMRSATCCGLDHGGAHVDHANCDLFVGRQRL